MKRFALMLAFGLVALSPLVADAQSLAGSSKECGTYSFDGDLTKGRTDGMVVKVDHSEGCYRYQFMTIIGADREEMALCTGAEGTNCPERNWQRGMCERAGREAAVGHFRYYRGMDIDPSSVKVSCSAYSGPD